MNEILISRPLAVDKDFPAWARLAEVARVHVRPLSSRARLIAHPRLRHAAGLITMVDDQIDAAFLDRAPRLKVIANHAVGVNNIDLAAAESRGIVVCNTPDVLTNATAELTIGLLIAAARRFEEGTAEIRTRSFKGWHPAHLLGRELAGARLGLIGKGRIGSAVAAKAQALGMEVVHSNRSSGLPLEQLLATSDFVSIHCPLNDETRGLLGPRELALMKQGSYLVNTARGELVDERALVTALRRNLRGAALDVFRCEPRLAAALRSHPRVFVLPHLGSATLEARSGMARLALTAVAEVLTGRSPANRVRYQGVPERL